MRAWQWRMAPSSLLYRGMGAVAFELFGMRFCAAATEEDAPFGRGRAAQAARAKTGKYNQNLMVDEIWNRIPITIAVISVL